MLFFHLVKQTGLLQGLMLDQIKLCKYLRKMEQGYDPNNPYHNRSAASIHNKALATGRHAIWFPTQSSSL